MKLIKIRKKANRNTQTKVKESKKIYKRNKYIGSKFNIKEFLEFE